MQYKLCSTLCVYDAKAIIRPLKNIHIRGSSIQTGIFQGKYMYRSFVTRDAQKLRVSAESYAETNENYLNVIKKAN